MHGHAVFSAHLCTGGEKWPTQLVPANQGFLKVSPDTAMLFSQPICEQEERNLSPFVHRRREMAHTVPTNQGLYIKLSPGIAMLGHRRRSGPPSATAQGLSKGEPGHGHAVVTESL